MCANSQMILQKIAMMCVHNNVNDVCVSINSLKLRQNRALTPKDLPINIYIDFAPDCATPFCSIINATLTKFML